MLGLAIIFFVIALIAYAVGAQGVAGMSAGIGRILLFVFLVLAVLVLHRRRWPPATCTRSGSNRCVTRASTDHR